MKITVTPKHYKKALEDKGPIGERCPITQAVKDIVGRQTYVSCGMWHIIIDKDSYELPDEAQEIARHFDLENFPLDFEPITFNLGNKNGPTT